jgi:thiosulfate dehydrogenase
MSNLETQSLVAFISLFLLCCSSCSRPEVSGIAYAHFIASVSANRDLSSIPEGPLGDSIRLGQEIFMQTPKYAAAYVGNQQSCNDCHIQEGKAPYAAPMIGLPEIFPTYNKRAGRVITLEDRFQECFVRSENGHPLPYDSKEMVALVAYVQWISAGYPSGKAFPGRGLVKLPDLPSNVEQGRAIYSKTCASCHRSDGAGEPPVLPAVWGPGAYNDGAGMNNIDEMAAFVQHNMPQNKPGSLTPQEAYDVAAYINSKPHSHFNKAYENY